MHAKLVALGTSVLLFLSAASGSVAQSSDLQIKDAWARATPTGAKTAAAYMSLTSAASDRLTGASTPVAQKAELHTMSMEGSVMKMCQVDGINLPAGQTVALRPGGYHVMLTGLTEPLKEGQSFPLTLTFAKSKPQEVMVTVQKVGSMNPGMTMPMHH